MAKPSRQSRPSGNYKAGPDGGPPFVGWQIVGLRELHRDLRKTAPEVHKALVETYKRMATAVADVAKSRVYPAVKGRSSAGTRIRGRRSSKGTGLSATRDSIRGIGNNKGGSIKLGGNKAPAAMGHEYGGGRRPTTRMFPAWRGNSEGAGYFLWPAIRQHLPEAVEEFDAFLEDVLEDLGREP